MNKSKKWGRDKIGKNISGLKYSLENLKENLRDEKVRSFVNLTPGHYKCRRTLQDFVFMSKLVH